MDELSRHIALAQQGDLDAFEAVVRQFHKPAVRYAHAVIGDHELAKDAAQDAFVQAYLSLRNLREPAAFAAWFRAIVLNCCRRLTRGKRIPFVPLEEALGVASEEPGPAEIVEKKEMIRRVRDALAHLPEPERTMTELFYAGEYSQIEIAQLLGVPATTVNNRLHSSRRMLRRKLGDQPEPQRKVTRPKEAKMALTYETTTRRLLKGDGEIVIRKMTRDDIPAMRRLDDEICAGLEFANAQRLPGTESGPGGPWSNDEELLEHFQKFEASGNMTLMADDGSGRLIGFVDLWAAHELQPFGDSLDIECSDLLWEYYGLGLETIMFEEAEKVARAAGLPALDVGTNTSSGCYPALRRFGMKVFYEHDDVTCKCQPRPAGEHAAYRELPPWPFDTTGLLRIDHWAPTDFVDFTHHPDRPGAHEITVDGLRVILDFWRLYEPGQETPIDCQVFAPPDVLNAPATMSKILREAAFIAGELGAKEMPIPCPSDMPVDESLVNVVKREFVFAWMRKELR